MHNFNTLDHATFIPLYLEAYALGQYLEIGELDQLLDD